MVRTLADDLALVEDDDLFGVFDGTDALSDNQGDSVLSDWFEGVAQLGVGFHVQR